MSKLSCALNTTVVAVVLTIILSKVLGLFATDEVKSQELSLKGHFMTMIVHRNKVLLISSAIVAFVVFFSVLIGYQLKPVGRFM